MRFIGKVLAGAMLTAGLIGAQVKQPQPKSPKEVEALMAIQNAQEPDARIAAVENLLTKFADTEYKVMALQIAAASAQQKNDFEKMMIYSERTLEADPKNYQAMLMVAGGLAQKTREFDLDKEEKLSKAEKYSRSAMELIKTAPKARPDITDEQWETMRKDLMTQGHESLGLVATVRKKYDVAVSEFKLALETGSQPEPATLVRLANVYNESNKPDEAIAALDKLNSIADVNPQIKSAAQAERNRAIKAKGGTAPAATTPATATPAPAKPATPAPAVTPAPAPVK